MIDASAWSPSARRRLNAAWWILPSLFCLWLYWYGLGSWFQQDDFAWLQLRQNVHGFSDVLAAMFTPSPHGTMRPLSERGYFLLFSALFGFDAFPYRVLVFITQFANLALLASIVWRLTGSKTAGFWAPVLWLLNSSLVVPMTWTSAYMQVLCGFCLLLGFHLFLRHVETERWRYYWLQWIPFLLGFLVMETTIVYPAILAAYALLCARKFFPRTLPMFVPSAVYGVLHMLLAPKQKAGVYSLHFDTAIFNTFATYWRWLFDPQGLVLAGRGWRWLGPAAVLLCTAAIVAVLVWAIRKREYLALFFLSWYLIVLAPVLPLREHVTDYYLTLPSMGTAMLLAYALARAWRAGAALKAVSLVALALVVAGCVKSVRAETRWWYERGRRVEALAQGVARARQLHPGETILLSGVDSDLFWGSIYDGVFPAIGVSDVYLAPRSEVLIAAHPEMSDVGRFVLQPALVQKRLAGDRLVVYDVSGGRMKAITQKYREQFTASGVPAPRRLDMGSAAVDDFAGDSWYAAEATHRWMAKTATVQIAGPQTAAERLHVKGYCPKEQVPVTLSLYVDGKPLQPVRITSEGMFDFALALPPAAVGKPSMELAISVDHTMTANGRELGLAFSLIEVR